MFYESDFSFYFQACNFYFQVLVIDLVIFRAIIGGLVCVGVADPLLMTVVVVPPTIVVLVEAPCFSFC